MPKEVSFTIKIDDKGTFRKVTVSAEELGKAVRNVQDESEKAKRSVVSWAEASQALDVMSNAIGDLQSVTEDLTKAYQTQLVAETQLETIMRQRMGASDDMIQSVKDLCTAQQELGVIGDEVQLSGAQQMATFLKNKQSLDVLIPAMNNLVAQQNGLNATTQDAVSIGNMMGKAMQGQVEVLQRVGITFDESQKKVLQFGDESERAAMLAEVITENVGNMNAELAKTDAGKQKQLENTLGDYKEELGRFMQQYSQLITILSQTSIAATGLAKLYTTLRSVTVALGVSRVAAVAWNATSVRMSALVNACSASMRGAAVSATTFRLALQGLMIATGIGAAVVALTSAMSYFITQTGDAKDSVDGLSEAEQRAKQAHEQTAQQIASVRSEMDLNIAKLKDFKGSKEQEKTLVQQMNTKYGEALGYYSTVAQWYRALTANSKTYCDQMINEIRLRELANQAADLMKQQHDIKYDENGNLRRYSKKNQTVTKVTGQMDAGDGKIIPIKQEVEVKGTSQLDKANQQLTSLHRQTQNVRKEMEKLAGIGSKLKPVKVEGWSATAPAQGKTGQTKGNASTTTTAAKTPNAPDPLRGSIDWYERVISDKQKQLEATATATTRKQLQQEIEGLQRELGMMKVEAGIEVTPKVEIKKNEKSIIQKIEDDLKSSVGQIHVEIPLDMDRLKELESIDFSNLDSVRAMLWNIKQITDPTSQGLAIAAASCEALGGAMQQLGADSAAAKAGMVMAAVGQLVLSFAQAMTDASKNWVTWLAFGIAGSAQLASLIGMVSRFATGGIVGGNQKSGDNVLVRVNSGEMILNAAQQARLFALANGASVYGASAQVGANFSQGLALPSVSVQTRRLQGLLAGHQDNRHLDISLKLRGRDLVAAVANETRTNSKRSNIR